jgi:hypothetical protein
MRILFVSGTAVGGSASSTRELATALAARGHEVGLLARVATAPRRWMLQHRLVTLSVARDGSAIGRAAALAASRIGRRARPVRTEPFREWASILVENSLSGVRAEFAPEVVVASSIGRMAWRSVRAELAATGVPSVLYLREESAIGHLAVSDAPPDLLLANAHQHEAAARAAGFTAHVVPSVVDLSRARGTTTREVVLFVNPVEVSGRDLAVGVARACPDLRFAFVESWPLSDAERRWLDDACAGLANVERRPRVEDLRLLYGDARVLLVPYRTNGRPRGGGGGAAPRNPGGGPPPPRCWPPTSPRSPRPSAPAGSRCRRTRGPASGRCACANSSSRPGTTRSWSRPASTRTDRRSTRERS